MDGHDGGARDAGAPVAAGRGAHKRAGSPRLTWRRAATTAALVTAALLLAACAAGANPQLDTPAPGGADPAGLWLGLWHGLILPITFVVSLFTDTVSVYEVHNTGNWYDVGFVIGIACSFGGGVFGTRGRKG
ncbi:hypothetical protein [Xylanimonas ulmi]|uniref:Uncharacterized protein n=1 Tax=Xylanimonas ulmi TaxID=228973 RepID=A0A4Q7M2G6_9MICO|nr:hypothetical protein [Xylanibacterium ulmi]RZS61153.1 hypothetical protein EV386_1441 [Xylanibacterium ulmi]